MRPIERHISEALGDGAPGSHIVGGAIRDLFLDLVPEDFDIVVPVNPKKYAAVIAARLNGKHISLGKPGFELERVVAGGRHYDICRINGRTISEDLDRRDFTINAMAWDLSAGELIDPCNGMEDLTNRKIRMVSSEGLAQDPVRLLRAFRLAASLDFTVESKTLSTITSHSSKLAHAPGERLRSELIKFLSSKESASHMDDMVSTGLLEELFPELRATRGCHPNGHQSTDVFTHTLSAYRHLEKILKSPSAFFPHHHAIVEDRLPPMGQAIVKLAVLLHGIGKPSIRFATVNSGTKTPDCETAAAALVIAIGKRLRWSRLEADQVSLIVSQHLSPLRLFDRQQNGPPHADATFRFFWEANSLTPHVCLHSAANVAAKQSDSDVSVQQFFGFVDTLLDRFETRFIGIHRDGRPILSGRDIMSRFGLPPSPLIGQILFRVEEARFSGIVRERDEAISAVEQWLTMGFKGSSPPPKGPA